MSICLVAIVKDEDTVIERCLRSALPLIDSYLIVDTGSTDNTKKVARRTLKDIHGKILSRPWRSFGENLTEALKLAQGSADWLLRLDADMQIEAHPDLSGWLATNPDPDVVAWQVEIEEGGTIWRLPLLTRASIPQRYVGATHEYLEIEGKQRPLLGLTVRHRPDRDPTTKFERDLALLTGDDPRSVFYRAETLRFLGRTEEAIETYQLRASQNGWDEERWYARYQAAKLAGDAEALIDAWRQRPHRHEPLSAAARLVAQTSHEDLLFLESV